MIYHAYLGLIHRPIYLSIFPRGLQGTTKMCGYWIRGEVFTLDSSIALCRLSSKCMQIYRYLLLLAILFAALLFIKAQSYCYQQSYLSAFLWFGFRAS